MQVNVNKRRDAKASLRVDHLIHILGAFLVQKGVTDTPVLNQQPSGDKLLQPRVEHPCVLNQRSLHY